MANYFKKWFMHSPSLDNRGDNIWTPIQVLLQVSLRSSFLWKLSSNHTLNGLYGPWYAVHSHSTSPSVISEILELVWFLNLICSCSRSLHCIITGSVIKIIDPFSTNLQLTLEIPLSIILFGQPSNIFCGFQRSPFQGSFIVCYYPVIADFICIPW